MAERPIIFSAPMVRALLDGRKTQTRRVLKPWPGMQSKWLTSETLHRAPTCYLATVDGHLGAQMQHPRAGTIHNGLAIEAMSPLGWVRLPYAPGDRLWVREAHAFDGPLVRYNATDDVHELRRKRPSIHMPRWASRLTLTVTDVRVQRLQEISAEDAWSEGIEAMAEAFICESPDCACGDACKIPARNFSSLWNSLHGPAAWDANPWVVALTFTVHRCNIDQMEAAHA